MTDFKHRSGNSATKKRAKEIRDIRLYQGMSDTGHSVALDIPAIKRTSLSDLHTPSALMEICLKQLREFKITSTRPRFGTDIVVGVRMQDGQYKTC